MADLVVRIKAAMAEQGITNAATFRARYEIGPGVFGPDEILAMLTRIRLAELPRPAGMDPDAWQQVCVIADGAHECPVSSTIGCPIGPQTLDDAHTVGCPVLEGEDLYDFAARFDTYARGLIAAAEAQAA